MTGRRAPLACGALVAALGGCTVGAGAGSAKGSLFVASCNNGAPYGTEQGGALAAAPYDLAPSFFAGTPTDDQVKGLQQMNVMEIQMKTTGLEFSDSLGFNIQSSLNVARCVHGGQMANGQPNYLVDEPLPAQLGTAANPAPTTLWCDWSGMAFSDGGAPDAAVAGTPDAGTALDGGMSTMAPAPRIHLTPYTDIVASLILPTTCQGGVAAAVGMDGWIQFDNFGTAEATEPTSGFVINYGDRLHATFDVILGDPRYVNAIQTGMPPPSSPAIGGELAGSFDFDLERGRAAQPFP
ncbi:MAG TPA: hypothetical protein VHO06_27700 [Polyangia bacterium]|nr:hypothetical protein [Polyangia bacterium]